MINFLKKHNKKIEFVLLFLPLFVTYIHLVDLWTGENSLEIFQYREMYSYSDLDNRMLILGDELMELISWFMPFIMWKVISKYWLK